ncbi:MAG: cell division protein FtsL [Acidobacteria bacterium]|jgi:cell division protein FtsL|nr:cell division protein FtsL [Acidobacteriota bacterium]
MAEITKTANSVGFVVQKDILNHPVREVDRARYREMWLTVLAVAILVVAVLVTLWQQAEVRQLGYDVERLQKAQAAEAAANYHLRVELEALRSLKRIEQLASQLNLVAPANGDAIVIERVMPSPAPAKGLVARR